MKKLNICGFFLICFVVCCVADCPLDVSTRDDEVFIYSNVTSTYDQALMICQSYGGDVFDIHAEDRQYFIEKFEKFYLKGLVEVLIYNKTQEHAPNRTYDYHKYRAHGISKDKSNLNGFQEPPTGELSSIRLSETKSADNPIRVEFCYFISRDLINSSCNTGEGWNINFFLYGADGDAKNTIQVYNYYAEDIGATSKLSLTPIDGTYWRQLTESITNVYLQDISVFIGAKSQLSEVTWSWSDGEGVDNPMFPLSNLSVCQQMTWPLTYDDGINLRPTDCNTGTAYFVCRVLFIAKLEEIQCNATSLLLSWEPLSAVFSDSNLMKGQLEVNLDQTEDPQTFEVDLDQSNVTLHGLKQRTTYNINIKLQLRDCSNFNPTTSASGRTGYGVPDPVKSAYAINSDNQCNIVWTHIHDEVAYYQITIQNSLDNAKYERTFDAQDKPENEILVYDVDLSLLTSNQTLTFKILAISFCGQKSSLSIINGTCKVYTSTHTITNPPLSFEAGIGVGISIGIVVMIVIAVVIKAVKHFNEKSKHLNEKSTKETVYENVRNAHQLEDTNSREVCKTDYINFQA